MVDVKEDYDSFILVDGEYQQLNNSQVIINTVDLTDYYTKNEINEKIAQLDFSFDLCTVVDELPTGNIDENRLYLILNNDSSEHNKFDVYIHVNDDWERIDTVELNLTDYVLGEDLDNYYTKSEIDSLIGDISTYLGQ